jgi:hypothetical protein
MVQFEDTVVASSKQMSENLDNEAILLNTESGYYFSLDKAGKTIWELVQKPVAVGDLHAALLEQFDVESEKCKAGLLSLLDDLQSEGLIEVSDAQAR